MRVQTLQDVDRLYKRVFSGAVPGVPVRESLVRTDAGPFMFGELHGYVRYESVLLVRDRVQFKRQGVTLCGRLRGVVPASEDGPERCVILSELGTLYIRPHDVRPCQSVGDGKCSCADAARGDARDERRAARRAVLPSPLGNTGVTA